MAVTVRYWRGTSQHEAEVETYADAMRIASYNSNAYGPAFYDDRGRELFDDGNGLKGEDDDFYVV